MAWLQQIRLPGLFLMAGVSPALATCGALLVDVPESVDPGEAIVVMWQATSSSAVPHTNIHYRLNSETGERPGTVFSFDGGADVFTDTIPTTGLGHGDEVHLRAHVHNVDGEDCFTASLTVPVIDSTPPPVPDPDDFEPDDQCDSATEIAPGAPTQLHSISPPGDVDAVTFVAMAGVRYAVQTRPTGTGGIDTAVEVYGPGGQVIAADDNGGAPPWDAHAEFVAASTARHCALIRGVPGKDGWYEARVRTVDPPSCATDLVAPPPTVASGDDLEIAWAAAADADIIHTHLHYLLPGDTAERGSAVLTAAAGHHVFAATLPTAALPTGAVVRVRSHVAVAGGVSCYSSYSEVVVVPGGALCAVALDDVPAEIEAGEDLPITWSFVCGTGAPHANLHYSGHGGAWERPGPVHSEGPGQHQFTDLLPVSLWPAGTVIHVRGHVRTAGGQDFYTPLQDVLIREPPVPCSTSLFSVPATVQEGFGFAVQWFAQAEDEIIHTNVHYRRQGEAREHPTPVEQGVGLFTTQIDAGGYGAGTVLILRSHVLTRSGVNCYSDERTVTIVPASGPCEAAITSAPTEAQSGEPVGVDWAVTSPGPGRTELIWQPVGSWPRVGLVRDIAAAGEWSFEGDLDLGTPSVGRQIDIWPRVYYPGGRCEGAPVRVTITAPGDGASAAAVGAPTVQVVRVERGEGHVIVAVAVSLPGEGACRVGLTWRDRGGQSHRTSPQTGRGRFRAAFHLPADAVRVQPWVVVGEKTVHGAPVGL